MSKSKKVHISGISGTLAAPMIAEIIKDQTTQCLIVTASMQKAKELAKSLSFFLPQKVYVLSEEEPFFLYYEAKSHGQMEARLAAVKALREDGSCIVIAPVSAAVKKLPPPDVFDKNSVRIHVGDDVDMETLKKELAVSGYERTSYIEAKGQISFRGGIVDVFPPDRDTPVRIEFFDTEVDSIRAFDPETQRSLEALSEIVLFPAEQMIYNKELFGSAYEKINTTYDKYINKYDGEKKRELSLRKHQLLEYIGEATNLQLLENYISYFYDNPLHIWDYLGESSAVIIDDPDRLKETLTLMESEAHDDFKMLLERGHAVPEDFDNYSGYEDFKKIYETDAVYFFTPFTKQVEDAGRLTEHTHVQAKQPPAISGRMEVFESELKRYVKNKYRIVIVCSSDERLDNLRDFLQRAELDHKVELQKGEISAGVELTDEKIVYFWEGELFASGKRKRTTREKKSGSPIKAFTDIQKGDFVVHENHGIGKFVGVEQLDIQGVKKDYLKIKYAGEDMLYIPVEQMSLIQKYIGGDERTPKVSKLSSGEWKKAKAKAKIDIANLAKELLEMSAARKVRQGYAFSKDTVWQKEFEDAFPYEETQDQLRSSESIKRDMERSVPMDRLLCGDVGYGKTEVAARAVFKCVADGKQAAILVPTTILANQHYLTFKERFADFPFSVEMLSRFRTEKQQEEILEKVKKGSIDIIIGTHRLLSKDVKYKDLGLLVVDEEQRFGVQHKEKIKAMKENLDVLTLSATPIPRTLHMSLVGIRDMDLIEEPPEDRYPVQTYVMEQNDELVRETIQRELDRDGQVYVVFNRVKGIQRIASEIKELVPEAEVIVGHGQMNEHELENVMLDFIEKKSNVLVATTIIESGIDIPNVNTIIIMDADRFGLSQLYQLRGRVGRSNRMAYAYLMYKKDKVLSEVAEKRLRAIREFTEFGAGFRIAMRDLEIRGAGNLLGTEQHGHMMTIGYELYCKLVDDAVRALEGEVVNPETEEVAVELSVAAYIPERYIEDEVLRLQMYKKIAFVETQEDESDVMDELIDRFGEVPIETEALISIARIRSMAEKAGILRIREEKERYVFEFKNGAAMRAEAISHLASVYKMRILIHAGAKPFISLKQESKKKLYEIIEFLSEFMI